MGRPTLADGLEPTQCITVPPTGGTGQAGGQQDAGTTTPAPTFPTTPTLLAFECGLAQEIQAVRRLKVGTAEIKVQPIPAGPIALELETGDTGGKVRVLQVERLEDLEAGRRREDVWALNPKTFEVKGLAPSRQFLVIVAEAGIRMEPNPLSAADRGPSGWILAPTVAIWSGK